jgi:hypothetical protein
VKKIRFAIGILLGFALLFGFGACDNGGTEDYKEFEEFLWAILLAELPTVAR